MGDFIKESIKTFFIVSPLLAFAYQIYHQRRERKRETTTLLYGEINTKEFRRALRFIYKHKPEELTINRLNDEQLEWVELITAHFDRLGFRMRTRQIYENDVYHLFRDPVIKAAQQLLAHQEDQRRRRGCGKHEKEYNPDFDWLARRLKLRQLKKKGIKISRNGRKFDLSTLLKIEAIPLMGFLKTKKEDIKNE